MLVKVGALQYLDHSTAAFCHLDASFLKGLAQPKRHELLSFETIPFADLHIMKTFESKVWFCMLSFKEWNVSRFGFML
ncbi:hypothetical protein ACMD2_02317 [Ananas comosus]|uniref:Uncharacterized protein n=1 Tax=Ananas comosus TaxID=4615 RepID=A0A199VD23_ANACO|nr:hypothetical protein ACMD2_02317 [Ananas comosus]